MSSTIAVNELEIAAEVLANLLYLIRHEPSHTIRYVTFLDMADRQLATIAARINLLAV